MLAALELSLLSSPPAPAAARRKKHVNYYIPPPPSNATITTNTSPYTYTQGSETYTNEDHTYKPQIIYSSEEEEEEVTEEETESSTTRTGTDSEESFIEQSPAQKEKLKMKKKRNHSEISELRPTLQAAYQNGNVQKSKSNHDVRRHTEELKDQRGGRSKATPSKKRKEVNLNAQTFLPLSFTNDESIDNRPSSAGTVSDTKNHNYINPNERLLGIKTEKNTVHSNDQLNRHIAAAPNQFHFVKPLKRSRPDESNNITSSQQIPNAPAQNIPSRAPTRKTTSHHFDNFVKREPISRVSDTQIEDFDDFIDPAVLQAVDQAESEDHTQRHSPSLHTTQIFDARDEVLTSPELPSATQRQRSKKLTRPLSPVSAVKQNKPLAQAPLQPAHPAAHPIPFKFLPLQSHTTADNDSKKTPSRSDNNNLALPSRRHNDFNNHFTTASQAHPAQDYVLPVSPPVSKKRTSPGSAMKSFGVFASPTKFPPKQNIPVPVPYIAPPMPSSTRPKKTSTQTILRDANENVIVIDDDEADENIRRSNGPVVIPTMYVRGRGPVPVYKAGLDLRDFLAQSKQTYERPDWQPPDEVDDAQARLSEKTLNPWKARTDEQSVAMVATAAAKKMAAASTSFRGKPFKRGRRR